MATHGNPKASAILCSGDMLEHALPAHKPAKPVEDPSVYRFEFVTTQESGAPLPAVELEISSPSKISIDIEGQFIKLGPKKTERMTTGLGGRLTATVTVPNTMACPVLTVHCPDFMPEKETRSFRADGPTYNRLANRDPDFEVSPEVMQANDLLPDSHLVNPFLPYLVDGMVAVAGLMADKCNGTRSAGSDVDREWHKLYFELDLRDPEDPRLTPLPEARGQALRAEKLPENVFRFASFAELEEHLAKHPNEKLAGVWSLIRAIKDLITKIATALTTLAKEALDAVVAFFVEILNDIAKLMSVKPGDYLAAFWKWVRIPFGFKDIADTALVLRHYVDHALQNMIGTIEQGSTEFIRQQFQTLRSYIDSVVPERHGESTRQSVSRNARLDMRTTPGLTYARVQPHGATANYLPTQAQLYLERSFPRIPGNIDSLCEQLTNTVRDAISQRTRDDFEKAVDDFTRFLNQHDGIRTLTDIPARDLLIATSDFVVLTLDLLEDVIVEVIQLIAQLLNAIRAHLLDSPLPIPILSQLYKKETGHDLCFLDLLALIIAAPATVLYRLFEKRAPFSPAAVKHICQQNIPWPFDLPSTLSSVPAPGGPVASVISKICGFIYLTSYMPEELVADLDNVPEVVIPPRVLKPVFWIKFAANVSVLALSGAIAPFTMKKYRRAPWTAEDSGPIIYWIVSWNQPVLDLICARLTAIAKVRGILDCCAGVVMLPTAANATWDMATGESYSGIDLAMVWVPPVQLMTKFALYDPDPDTQAVLLVAVLAADVICGGTVTCLFWEGADLI